MRQINIRPLILFSEFSLNTFAIRIKFGYWNNTELTNHEKTTHKYIMNAHVFMWHFANPTLESNKMFLNWIPHQVSTNPLENDENVLVFNRSAKFMNLWQICSDTFIDGFHMKPPIMDWVVRQKIALKIANSYETSNNPLLNARICRCAECCDVIKSRFQQERIPNHWIVRICWQIIVVWMSDKLLKEQISIFALPLRPTPK